MENNIGYCCISIGVNENKKKKDYLKVNRGMIKKTFKEKGLDYVSELVILNLKDTLKILDYNIKNNILVYRLSSDSFPWMSEYEIDQLPNFKTIKYYLSEIGNKIKNNNLRTSYHPGPFTVLSSENENVVKKSIKELNQHAQLLDLMGLEQSNFYPINIHVNTTKPTREEVCVRFISNFQKLSASTKKRLTIENDDKKSQYSVKLLYNLIYKKIKIPIVFDQHHYHFGPKDQSLEEAFNMAYSTWETRPLMHMSSSKKLEDFNSRNTAHANYIYDEIKTFGKKIDIEIEAKAKDLAVFNYKNKYILEKEVK